MDQFGADPQIRTLRSIFRQMEEYDLQATRSLKPAWTDERLRRLRELALAGHQAQLNRLAALRTVDGQTYLEAYKASYNQAATEMGLATPELRAK